MMRSKSIHFCACYFVGALAGVLGARARWQSVDADVRQFITQSRETEPIGITAALLHRDETLLVDARAPSTRDLPVPGAVSLAQLKSREARSRCPLIIIGAPDAVRQLKKTHRVAAFVPPFTLHRETDLPPQWEISGAQLQSAMRRNTVRVLDVREEYEFRAGCIPRSERVSMFDVDGALEREKPVAFFCLTGHRSAFLVQRLRARGYTNVLSVRGGWLDWKAQNRPLLERSAK